MVHNINCEDPRGGWEYYFIICNKEYGNIVREELYNMTHTEAMGYLSRLARNYWVLVDQRDPITHEIYMTWDSRRAGPHKIGRKYTY